MKKTRLKGINAERTSGLFSEAGEPKFRAEQVFNWMYNHLADDFAEMKNLPKSLRSELSESAEIDTLSRGGL